MATGCGSSTSATPSTPVPTTAPQAFTGTALAWLTTQGRPLNQVLNHDQATVLRDTKDGTETNVSAFFDRLAAACRQFRHDAVEAQQLPAAPSAVLASAWRTMATTTEAYASSCLTLARTHTSADLTRWNNRLKAMDTANRTLNAEVATVRGTAG